MTLDDFYKQKIAALLHDPPSKCWFIDGTRGKRDHEAEAKEIAERLFDSEEIARLIDSSEVRKADHLAASFDRWLLEVAMGGKYEPDAYKVKSSKLLNQFTKDQVGFASIETRIPPKFDEHLNDFLVSLHDLISEERYRGKWREIYHILYASLEHCWTKEVGVIGPADTRVPTHSIFDHLYATTTTLNMLDERCNVSGYFVTIDLAGIQGFISAARKLLDLRAGSWIVSALAWSIVEEFVKILGPDILVLPTARGNPFYFHTFRGLTRESGKQERYEGIGKSSYGYDNYPVNPVIPGTLSFIIPKRKDILSELSRETGLDFNDKGNVADSIREIFRQKWKSLSTKLADNKIEETCRQLGVFDAPPLRLRVSVEDISNSPSSSVEQAHSADDCHSQRHSTGSEYLAYHRAFHNASKELRKQSKLKVSPFVDLRLTENTTQGYAVCHVCGVLPSSKTEDHENLCCYCAIRRNLTKQDDGFARALEALFGFRGLDRIIRFRIPSVSDISLLPFIEKLREKVKRKPELEDSLDDFWKRVYHAEYREQILQLLGEVEENSGEEMQDRLDKEQKYIQMCRNLGLAKPNPYFTMFRADMDNMGKLISGLLGPSKMKENGGHGGVSSLDFDLFDHLSRSTENLKLRSVIKSIGAISEEEAVDEKDFDTAVDIAFEEFHSGRTREDLANDFKCLYHSLKEGCSFSSKETGRHWKSNLILNPSYHATLSRTLMRLATETAQIIQDNDGELIYAGGDDVVAILPAEKALQVARVVRDRFRQDESKQKGFLKLLKDSQAYISSMGDLGVSVSILFSHYKFPLSVALEQSIENEENSAKMTKWIGNEGHVLAEKDTLVLEYSPRGGQHTVGLVPLYDNTTIDLLIKLSHLMRYDDNQPAGNVILSRSFLRDLSELDSRIYEAYKSGNIAKLLLRWVVSRNCQDKKTISELTDDLFKTLVIRCGIIGDEQAKDYLLAEVIKASLAINGAIA